MVLAGKVRHVNLESLYKDKLTDALKVLGPFQFATPDGTTGTPSTVIKPLVMACFHVVVVSFPWTLLNPQVKPRLMSLSPGINCQNTSAFAKVASMQGFQTLLRGCRDQLAGSGINFMILIMDMVGNTRFH